MNEQERVAEAGPATGAFHPVRDLALAFGFMTIVPIGRAWPEDGARDMVGYFPWVGALLGVAGAGLAAIVHVLAGGDPLRSLLGGSLVVGAWAVLTRFLHWDGLADTADGLGCRDPERRLSVMRDSATGAFGATAIAFAALVQVVAAASLVATGAWPMLLVTPIVGRLVATSAAWSIAPAGGTGLGALVAGKPRAAAFVPAALAIAFAVGIGWWRYPRLGVAVVVSGFLVGTLCARWLSREVGGLTGDILGASILLTEAATLVAAALLL